MNSHKVTRTAAGALSLLTMVGVAVTTADHAQARMNVHCAGGASARTGLGDAWSVGTAQIDPIASRGEKTSMHEHQFFGNIRLLNMDNPELANYNDCSARTPPSTPPTAAPLSSTATSAALADSRARARRANSFSAPTLKYISGPRAGQYVPILRYEMYYQSWNDKVNDPKKQTNPFPADLRMISGNAMAQTKDDANINAVNFSCGNFSSKAARNGSKFFTPRDADCSTAYTIPGGNPSLPQVNLTAIVHFPTRWSGRLNDHQQLGNTADYSGDPMFASNQMAYTVKGKCPAGFGVKVPKARFTWQWDYRGDGTDVAFSSDMMLADPANSGINFHADFWNTWDQPTLRKAVNYCINTTQTELALHDTKAERQLCGIPVP